MDVPGAPRCKVLGAGRSFQRVPGRVSTFSRHFHPERAKLALRSFRRKSKPTPKAPQNIELPPMPEGLSQKAGAVNALQQTVELLGAGLFPGRFAEAVRQATAFQSAVLENAKKDLEAHELYKTYFPKDA